MEKPQVVHLGPEIALCSARYQPHFDLHVLAGGAVPAGFAGSGATALIAAAPVPAEVIAALPALRLIAVYGVGYDKVDLAAARARGIAVTNTPGPTDGCVADMAFALLLAAARGIVSGDRFVRDGKWQSGSYPLMPRLHSRPMGILGMGRIGQAIARRAAAFDMAIGYHNRRPREGVPHRFFESLMSLAQWCDVLVLAAPGGAGTRHLVNAEVLDALGPQGFLVNVGRGSVVDTEALAAALRDGRIAGAGIDVYESEPERPEPLIGLSNVLLTPHLAGWSPEATRASFDRFRANAEGHFAGRGVVSPF